jgi:carbonic anhydrase
MSYGPKGDREMNTQSTDRSEERQDNENRSEVTTREEPGPGNIETALARNREFAAAGGHEGAVVLPNLRLFVVTCLDPRVDPAHFLGLELSDAMVVRNVGGRVTPEVVNDLAFIGQIVEGAIPEGPLFEVAVIHHTQCGAAALAYDEFRSRYAERIGGDESTLREHAVLDPAETVRSDVERIRSSSAISPRIAISGHVYDVVTGRMQTILHADTTGEQSVEPQPSAQGETP